MQSLPSSFNPSDYEFLIKSLTQDPPIGKSESLKRLNTLVATDKKQFSGYAKRIVVCMQELLLEPREDINLLASTLALQIINLNPREIEYYVRTKLLKNLVKNLGDAKPQIRKTSHYCLLAYVKTYRSFDDLISNYIMEGLYSDSWQLKQKCVNSFQSILIMEARYLNWAAPDFKRYFELLIDRLNDESPYVQKAAQQCLISLCKLDNVRAFSKRLSPDYLTLLKSFLEQQKQHGTIQQIKIDMDDGKQKVAQTPETVENKTLSSAGQSLLSFDKSRIDDYKSFNVSHNNSNINRQGTPLLEKIAERQKSLAPSTPYRYSEKQTENREKLAEKIELPKRKFDTPSRVRKEESSKSTEVELPPVKSTAHIQRLRASNTVIESPQLPPPPPPPPSPPKEVEVAPAPMSSSPAPETLQGMMGRKILDDLKNDKDWKVRSDAIEELQKKFEDCKDKPEAENVLKSLLPILMRMLSDPNFKISLASMKMVQEIFGNTSINLDMFLSSLIDKLADSKIAIRQNVARIIRNQFSRTQNSAWIDNLLQALRRPNTNNNAKQEILSLLYKFYESDEAKSYNYERVLNELCPLMEDMKTKIKIKTLDCLVMVALKSGELQVSKSIVGGNINQVYYEMFIEKVNKELKTGKWNIEPASTSIFNKKASIHKSNVPSKLDTLTTSSSSKNQTASFSREPAEDSRQSPALTSNTVSMEIIGDSRRRKYSSGMDYTTGKRNHSINSSLASTNERAAAISIAGTSARKTDELIFRRSQDDNVSEKSYGVIKSFRKKIIRMESKTEYTSREGLLPLQNPQKEFKVVMENLKSEEWQIGFEALNKLRRIIENHSELITSQHTHSIVQDILKLVESARSSLSKNAMITLNELTNKVRRMLDADLDFIFGKLIKKAADTNSFITEEVKKAFVSLAENCGQAKVTTQLTTHHQSKSFSVKQTIVYILENVVNMSRYIEKDLSRIVSILVSYLNQGSLEIRQRTKKIILQLLESVRGEDVAKMIPSDHLSKIRKKEPKEERDESANNELEKSVVIPKPEYNQKKPQKITQFPAEFQAIESLLQKCESSDWKQRVEGMKEIHDLSERFQAEFVQYKLSSRVIDVLSKQISDPNLKVALNALGIFNELAVRLPSLVQNNLAVVANEIFNCFGSNKLEIRTQAELLFDSIANSIETWMLFQHLCNGSIYGIQKARPVILEKLVAVSERVYQKKPLIYGKNIYNTLNKLLDENRPDLQNGLQQLAESCRELVGNQIFSNCKSTIRDYIS